MCGHISVPHTCTHRAFGATLGPTARTWELSLSDKEFPIKSKGVKRNDCFPIKPLGKAGKREVLGAALGTCSLKYSHYFPGTKL